MAMVNPMLNIANVNVKDSRWLTLEVCREFQRNKCTRSDQECKFAHPPPHVEVQNGRVTACFDSIKGKCQRKDPPCKYLHPPQHLREQLLQNGRNNLIMRNLQMQAAQAAAIQPMMHNLIPTVTAGSKPPVATYPAVLPGQYPFVPPQFMGGMVPSSGISYIYNSAMPTMAVQGAGNEAAILNQQIPGVVSAAIPSITAQQKMTRPDRLEVCREFQRGTCTRQPSECRYAHPPDNVTVDTSDNHVTVCMDYVKGKCTRDSCRYFHPPPHLQAQIKATQQRANAVAAQAQALPQVVEVLAGKKRPRDPADAELVLQSVPGLISYKRMAIADNKSGLPVYPPGTNFAGYHQAIAAMQLQTLQQQQPYVPVTLPLMVATPTAEAATMVAASSPILTNANSVNYFDDNKQLLDTLPVCRDFKLGQCKRPQCKYVHLLEDYVEVTDGKVTVCRDAVRGKCTRTMCKYYHIQMVLPNSF